MAGVEDCGNGNVNWKGKKKKKSQAFRVPCFQCCVTVLFLADKKCKAIKSTVDTTRLHRASGYPVTRGCDCLGSCPCESLLTVFLKIYECKVWGGIGGKKHLTVLTF